VISRTRTNTQIVLVVIDAVAVSGQKVIGFDNSNRPVPAQPALELVGIGYWIVSVTVVVCTMVPLVAVTVMVVGPDAAVLTAFAPHPMTAPDMPIRTSRPSRLEIMRLRLTHGKNSNTAAEMGPVNGHNVGRVFCACVAVVTTSMNV